MKRGVQNKELTVVEPVLPFDEQIFILPCTSHQFQFLYKAKCINFIHALINNNKFNPISIIINYKLAIKAYKIKFIISFLILSYLTLF